MTDTAGEVLRATAARAAAELAAPVATAAGRLVDLVPDDPAGTVGRLGDSRDPLPPVPAWRQRLLSHTQRVTGSASAYTTPRDRVGSVSSAVAHRLLGALEAAVRALEVTVPEVTAARLGSVAAAGPDAPGEHFYLTDVDSRFDAFAVPTQLVGLRAPSTEPLVVALVRALAGTPPVAAMLDVGDGPIPWMAAEHGRRHLAVAVAVAAVVVRAAARAGEPACPDGPEAVVGVALEAVSQVLHERPMPPAWTGARLREHRASWVLPRRTGVRLRAHDGRFALVEGADVPVAGAGRVSVVPGGVVVRTRTPDAAVELEVDVEARPPGEPAVADWDEIVETSFVAVTGGATVVGEPGSARPGPEWPGWEFGLAFPWPGPVRVRVHARHRDGGPESYLLTLWEAEPAPDAVLLADDPSRPVLPHLDAELPAIVRTAFGDATAWRALCDALVVEPGDPLRLPVVDDARFDGLAADRLVALAGPEWTDRHGELVVVDGRTLSEPGFPVLVVGLLDDDRGRTFRATAASVAGISENLRLGNLSFTEFVAWAGDGVLDAP